MRMPEELNLKSIDEEARACREAFKNIRVGALTIHCHHERLFELLTEPADNRIAYILSSKSEREQALRLRLFRAVDPKILPQELKEAFAKSKEAFAKSKEADAKSKEAFAKWEEADAKSEEADAKWEEAFAKSKEAFAKWEEADAKWEEADAKWEEADAKSEEADAKWLDKLHRKICKNCPWDGSTIFPRKSA
jgi:hypothetical protein